MPAPAEDPIPTEESIAHDASLPASKPDARRGPFAPQAVEIGGPPGPEPTRFGDWEKSGRCIDF